MVNQYNHPQAPLSADPTLGIETFAPDFWKLIATQEPMPHGAMPVPPGPPVPGPDEFTRSPSPQKPPLTNDGLEALRESVGGFADNLKDIPRTPPPPQTLPKLTNKGLRDLRDPASGSGDLQDIPSPPQHLLPQLPHPEFAAELSANVREIGKRRGENERLEKEKWSPGRSDADRTAFDQEILENERVIREQEGYLEKATRHISRRI